MYKTYKGLITKREDIPKNGIYVFGSNTEGRHGKGSALVARNEFGAYYGRNMGPQGRSYAICTKDLKSKIHPSIKQEIIEDQIQNLYNYAGLCLDELFYIAYSGTGTNLNSYTPQEMADMFSKFEIPENMVFEEEFAKLLKIQNL